jgi:hypothetical protein
MKITPVRKVRECDCEAYPFCEHAITCARCGHPMANHERSTGPCDQKTLEEHCVCYQFQRKE